MTRTKSSSLATTLPRIRKQGALGSPSCSIPSCVTVIVILGALLGSWARQHYIGLGLFVIFDLESRVIVTVLFLLTRVLWRQGDGRGRNIRLKNAQSKSRLRVHCNITKGEKQPSQSKLPEPEDDWNLGA